MTAHTLESLVARLQAALETAGLDPTNVDVALHLSGNWVSVGVSHGERDYTVKEARALAAAIGDIPDGPPGIGFVHRRVDGIGFTVSHARKGAAA